MSDRELLEAAARAIGKEGFYDAYWGGFKSPVTPGEVADEGIDASGAYTFWNPLKDDGDALRLAVKLHFTVRCYMGNTCVQATVPGGPSVMVDETNHMDPFSAIRRAITRAAASMGGKSE